MTEHYYETKKADYTLRIANLDTLRNESLKRGNLLHARACERKMQELTEALEKLEHDRDGSTESESHGA